MNAMRTGTGHKARGFISMAIILCAASLCTGDILNPSFEQCYLLGRTLMPKYWNCNDHSAFGYYVSDSWSSEGSLSATIYSRIGQTVGEGGYESIYQIVDLTQVNAIVFDAMLSAHGGPSPVFEGFEAAFLVDGVVLWSETAEGAYFDQKVDVSDLSGAHTIELRNMALVDTACGVSSWTQWDNLQAVEGPSVIEATVEIKPEVLKRPSLRQWITCYIELPNGYSVNDIDGETVTLELAKAHMGWQGWAKPLSTAANTTDQDEDGIPERMVRFGKFAICEVLGMQQEEVTLTVTGELTDGTPFQGADVVRVVNRWDQWTDDDAGCQGNGSAKLMSMLNKMKARMHRLPQRGGR